MRIYVADNPRLTARARRFLRDLSHRGPYLSPSDIRSTTGLRAHEGPGADQLLEAICAFQERYGGLTYSVIGGNMMEYGLDAPPSLTPGPLGLAFPAILDGDWTWGLDVLLDGSTAMGPGRWPYRVIDRSADQRIERHALMTEVRGWPHRTFECHTPSHVPPVIDEAALPAPVPEATGPAEFWWRGGDVAVQAALSGWPAGEDRWTVRYFAALPRRAAEANPAVHAATAGYETVPATWCVLCSGPVLPGRTCLRGPDR